MTMKSVFVALLALAALASATFVVTDKAALNGAFQMYKTKFNKTYPPHEESMRFRNFVASLERVEKRNLEATRHGGATFGITKFSDMSVEEFKRTMLGYKPKNNAGNPSVIEPTQVGATNVDWRTRGAVTPVKDQGQCGSCWAFSAVEEVESLFFLKNGNLPVLAPQQLVSCDTVDGGCDGGDMPTAYEYMQKAGGVVPEVDMPYSSGKTGLNGACTYNHSKVMAPINGFSFAVPPCYDTCNNQDENKLGDNLASNGPISICVHAESWQDYSGGVMRSNCPHAYNDLDHCVQLVGMTDDYWIVRNSWNTDWGINGYIHIAKAQNLCGIADEATIVHF